MHLKTTRSETLKLMGVYAYPISYNTNRDLTFPFVPWEKIKERISKYPEEAEISPMPCPPLQFALINDKSPIPAHVVETFIRTNPLSLQQQLWYKSSVIAVCRNKQISGEVLELLLNEGPKETLAVRTKLLPNAIQSENIGVIRVLINHFPWILTEKIEPDYDIPLHNCYDRSPELIQLLLKEGIRHRVGDNYDVGGLFLENMNGKSLFDILFDNLLLEMDKGTRLINWKRIEVCIQCAASVWAGTRLEAVASSSPSFHCIGFVPSHFLVEALEVLDLRIDPSDVFDLIDMATDIGGWKDRVKLSSRDFAKLFRLILLKLKHKKDENVGNSRRGCLLPLHFAAMRGLGWESGLKEILLSDYSALRKHDEITGLLPFMAAACGASSSELDAIYQLLKNNPSQADITNHS